jgi:hypothetical protein
VHDYPAKNVSVVTQPDTRDRNLAQARMQRRLVQIDESIARYLSQLDSADRQGGRSVNALPTICF